MPESLPPPTPAPDRAVAASPLRVKSLINQSDDSGEGGFHQALAGAYESSASAETSSLPVEALDADPVVELQQSAAGGNPLPLPVPLPVSGSLPEDSVSGEAQVEQGLGVEAVDAALARTSLMSEQQADEKADLPPPDVSGQPPHPDRIGAPPEQVVAPVAPALETAVPIATPLSPPPPLKPAVKESAEVPGSRALPQSSAERLALQSMVAADRIAGASEQSAAGGEPGGRIKALENALMQVSQAPVAGRQEADAAAAVTALKRLLTVSQRPAGAESLSRTEGVTPHAPAQPTPAAVSTAPPGAGLISLSVEAPLQQPDWQQALGERIQWLVGQRLQGAQIRLNPAHLGPMEVRVQVQHDQASIQFLSAHTVVRDALEAAVPRLRDMLDSSGLDLVDVGVSDHSFAGEQRDMPQEAGGDWRGRSMTAAEGSPDPVQSGLQRLTTPLIGAGRLDLFV